LRTLIKRRNTLGSSDSGVFSLGLDQSHLGIATMGALDRRT
jgi:hypothetical protein